MTLTVAQLDILRPEVTSDPLGRGYADMSDAQVADDINTFYRTRSLPTLTGGEIFSSIDEAEYVSIPGNANKNISALWGVLGLSGPIDVGPGSNARKFLASILGSSATQTIANIDARRNVPASRAQELGLPFVDHIDVARAREAA